MPAKKGCELYVVDDAGHQTTLTPELGRRLIAEVRKGRWPEQVAVSCNLDPRTLRKWIERGTDDVAYEPFKSFASEFLRAESDFCAEMEEVLVDAALGRTEFQPGKPRPNAEVAKYLLERRMKPLWGGEGMSALEVVARNGASKQKSRAKALEFLESLPLDVRQKARDKGIMLPDSSLSLPGCSRKKRSREKRQNQKTNLLIWSPARGGFGVSPETGARQKRRKRRRKGLRRMF